MRSIIVLSLLCLLLCSCISVPDTFMVSEHAIEGQFVAVQKALVDPLPVGPLKTEWNANIKMWRLECRTRMAILEEKEFDAEAEAEKLGIEKKK
jgi:hypothetical protein